jgi:hypothetical protein
MIKKIYYKIKHWWYLRNRTKEQFKRDPFIYK